MLDSFLVLAMVERLKSDLLILWTGVFYTGNKVDIIRLI